MAVERPVEFGPVKHSRETQQFADNAFRNLALGAGALSFFVIASESAPFFVSKIIKWKQNRQKPQKQTIQG